MRLKGVHHPVHCSCLLMQEEFWVEIWWFEDLGLFMKIASSYNEVGKEIKVRVGMTGQAYCFPAELFWATASPRSTNGEFEVVVCGNQNVAFMNFL